MFSDRNTTSNSNIDSITCEVKNCEYNDRNLNCMAKQIRVGPGFAATKNDTVCGTFKQIY